MQAVEPVMVVDLFPQERKLLLELFSELTEEDWHRPTVCPGWTVKDIGLHLLGDDLGYISGKRDHFSNPFLANKDMEQWESLVQNINEANELWVRATQRISPALLSALLALTGNQFYEYISSLDQMAMNGVVSWAGPDAAPVWLDTAREYTERWLHQQQIRDAVHKPGLKDRKFFHPVLDAFVRALPHTYRDVAVMDRTVIKLVVTGEAGDIWYLVGEANKWSLYKTIELQLASVVTMDQETCWRLFTKGIDKERARANIVIEGDQGLGEKMLETVSIIA
ncbi:MAG TPA: maleylpyruvate isomerase family mycothiol-dependent enzyme [Ktedonobacteraceae bacterium]|nr:maleylpyruvate isomerase family mycothiol-dependent enzyme [Ktedonobacteraceae bacterium]